MGRQNSYSYYGVTGVSFPNILRIDHVYKPQLSINLEKVKPLELDPYESITDKIRIINPLFNQDEVRKKILIMLNMNKVIQHIWNEIRAENTTQLTPVFDKEHPIRSTADVRTWWTSKPCEDFKKTHINFTVVDSTWEFLEAKTINESTVVESFVKNDHLGFAILYNYQGVIRRYFPDFIIKLKNGVLRGIHYSKW